jgi:hypothetical protein
MMMTMTTMTNARAAGIFVTMTPSMTATVIAMAGGR